MVLKSTAHFLIPLETLFYLTSFRRYDSYDERDDKRYYDDRYEFEPKPKPAPRNMHSSNEEIRYRRDVPLDRYRNHDKFDPKRRSMFSLIEEEHKKNSNEIAKELKRRSYMDGGNNYEGEFYKERSYQELPESERYPFSKSAAEIDKVGEMKYDAKFLKNQKLKNPSYRHSYAEPKLRLEKTSKYHHHPELLHRTNSSVSNTGRVGIASVHPY